jgi:hypothetical protein
MVDRAILEHNIHAITLLYTSISLKRMAELLGVVNAEKVEQICARMIVEKRIQDVWIDRLGGMVFFGDRKVLFDRDSSLNSVLSQLNSIASTILTNTEIQT